MNISLVVARTPKGEIDFLYKGEASDPALDLMAKLKKSKGRDEKSNKLLYSEVEVYIRPRPNRKLKFS